MAFPTSTTDVIVGAIESRRKKVQDNITKNNALLTHLKEKGRILFVTGGNIILEELSFAENGNANYYSGYDLLPVAAQDVIGAAQFTLKQAAVPVVISGLELLQNDGREKQLDLMEARLGVAEGTLANIITQGLYSDGTIFNGKALVGLDAAAEATVTASQTSTYGGISRTNFSFWRSQCTSTSADISTAAKCQGVMNALWATTIRGADMPDFGIMDNNFWRAVGHHDPRRRHAGLRDHGQQLLGGLDGQPPGDYPIPRREEGQPGLHDPAVHGRRHLP